MHNVQFDDIRPIQWTPALHRLGGVALVIVVALRSLQIERKNFEYSIHETESSSFSSIYINLFLALSLFGIVFACIKSIKPSGLEINYLTHENFLSLLKKLYPTYEAAGLCRGYSFTVKNDLMEGSSSFMTTLKKLDNLMGRLKGEDLIREIKKDKDLSNLFNDIYTHYDKQKSDNLLGAVSGVYTNPRDLLPLMISFQEQLSSASIPFKALVFLIGSKDHNIVFGFNAEENVYRLIDANDLNSNIFPLASVSKQIDTSYDLPAKSKAFAIRVFLSTDKENESKSKRTFDAWKASILSEQIQSLPSLSEEEKSNWLYEAAYSNDEQSVSLLIDRGVNANQANKKEGFTPLHAACQNGHKEVVRMLIANADNVDLPNKSGSTPFYIACQNGQEEIAEILLDQGADVNQPNKKGTTPIYIACQNGHKEVVKMLIDRGADVNQKNQDGNTPLHVASANGHEEVVKILFDQVDNVNLANRNGCTPLYMACQEGHEAIVKLYFDRVDNINQANRKGCTLLYVASRYGHEGVVKILIAEGADVNRSNEDRITPLHAAAQFGHEQIVQILIDAKANVNLVNGAGYRPSAIARYMKHTKIEQMLLAAESKSQSSAL